MFACKNSQIRQSVHQSDHPYTHPSMQYRNDYVSEGYCTSKGELVCAILYPKPLDFRFYQDSVKFILFLACMAVVGMAYSLVMYIRNNVSMLCCVNANCMCILTCDYAIYSSRVFLFLLLGYTFLACKSTFKR